MTTRVTEGARRERHARGSPLPRACTALTKSEEKETARSLEFTKPLFISVFSMLPLSMFEHVFLGQFFVVPHFDAL